VKTLDVRAATVEPSRLVASWGGWNGSYACPPSARRPCAVPSWPGCCNSARNSDPDISTAQAAGECRLKVDHGRGPCSRT
jgi:hypothetical protein